MSGGLGNIENKRGSKQPSEILLGANRCSEEDKAGTDRTRKSKVK